MATYSTWMGFFVLMGVGVLSFSSLFPTFPFSSSAPLISSYSSGAIYSDLDIPLGTSIRGYWRQGKDMVMSNEQVGQVTSMVANTKVGDMAQSAKGSLQEFKEKQAAHWGGATS